MSPLNNLPRATPDDLSPAAAEHRHHRNHTAAAAPATA
jgi:hypothetical protein